MILFLCEPSNRFFTLRTQSASVYSVTSVANKRLIKKRGKNSVHHVTSMAKYIKEKE